MNRTVCIKGTGLPWSAPKRWALVFRSHDLAGTDYQTICLLSDEDAIELVETTDIRWLHSEPNWQLIAQERKRHEATVALSEAEAALAALGGAEKVVPGEGIEPPTIAV